MKGDASGAFTFQSTIGKSLVDYFIASPGIFDNALSLYVQDSVPESDHCPLTLRIAMHVASQLSEALPTPPLHDLVEPTLHCHDKGPGLIQ